MKPMTMSHPDPLWTNAKRWSDRDFDECCYPVSGYGNDTMVCAQACEGSYCRLHRSEMVADFTTRPREAAKVYWAKRTPKPVAAPVARPKGFLPDIVARKIVSEVAKKYGTFPALIMSRNKDPGVTFARHMAMWRIRQLRDQWGGARYSFPSIGRAMGRDQSSIQHAVERIDRWIADGSSPAPVHPVEGPKQEGFAGGLT